jgi:MFS superfamily sulfate permease-like transporter
MWRRCSIRIWTPRQWSSDEHTAAGARRGSRSSITTAGSGTRKSLLGRPPGVEGYHDVTRSPDARQIRGLILFSWDARLFFANADLFRDRVTKLVAEGRPPARLVVVAAEPITDVDTTAADMLERLRSDLEEAWVGLAFAEMKDPVKDKLERNGQITEIRTDAFFPRSAPSSARSVPASRRLPTEHHRVAVARDPRGCSAHLAASCSP